VAVPASQGLASQGLASHSLASQGSASQGKYLNTTLQNKAIAPTCSTVLVPLSSTCNVGVNTVSGNDKRQLQGTAANKAILPSCSTIYSTSTSCNAGVHPQPTFTGAPVTVTQLTYPSVSAAPVTTTVTTIADLSVSATLAGTSAASDYIFFLTPTLQQDIIDIAETFCTPARQKRQIASAPSCSLDPSYQQAFVNGVASLVDGDVIATGTQLAPGLAAIVIGAEIFKLWSTSSVQPLGLSLGVGGGDVSSVVSSAGSSSSQPPPAPTLYPGPPNCNYTSMESSDIFLLTSYWAAAFDLVTTSSSACHFGTSVGISSTQSYCICTDGFYHSISPVTITTTVNGSPTQTVDYCPYTSIPSATIAAGPTIASPLSIPPPTSLVAPTSSAASLSLSAPTCFSGPSAFKDKDMSSGISEFCASASKSGWSVTQTTALTTYGQFSSKHHAVLSQHGSVLTLEQMAQPHTNSPQYLLDLRHPHPQQNLAQRPYWQSKSHSRPLPVTLVSL